MIVTQMQLAQTQLEVIHVVATLDSLEMDLHVQVSHHHILPSNIVLLENKHLHDNCVLYTLSMQLS